MINFPKKTKHDDRGGVGLRETAREDCPTNKTTVELCSERTKMSHQASWENTDQGPKQEWIGRYEKQKPYQSRGRRKTVRVRVELQVLLANARSFKETLVMKKTSERF